MGYVLGLDLGPSSIGWAAVNIDDDGNYKGLAQLPDGPNLIPAIGARIFPAGVERYGQGQREQTRNKTRREKRGTRRTLRRRKARRTKLIALLRANNILPQDDAKLQKLQQQTDPYELRAKAIKEDEQLSLMELGRIFLHLCKKRGFKSNRKAPPKKEEKGEINEAKTKFKEELGNKTPGQFWNGQIPAPKQSGPFKAIRNKGGKFQSLAIREQYKEEFNKIWENQKKIYQKNGNGSFFSVEMKKQIESFLFDQISYKQLPSKMRKMWGRCSLMPKEFRCSLANRKAQQFRFLQKVNDIRVIKRSITRGLNEEERKKIINLLSCKNEVKTKEIRTVLKLLDDERLNFEFDDDNALTGNEIDSQLCKLVGKDVWLNLSEETRDKIWQEILKYIEDEKGKITEKKTADEIYKICGIKIDDLDKFSEIELPDGNVKFCEKVLNEILPKMSKEGLSLSDAIKAAKFTQKWDELSSLPVPDKKAGFYITNPNVATVLYQVHRLVNRLIAEIGKPEKIVVEFTRDLKASKEQRQKILKQQSERRRMKALIAEDVQKSPEWKWGGKIPQWAIEKYMLWVEQNTLSPYSGDQISKRQLFGEDTQIDHILPYSMSLDNSLNNKVVCFTSENQEKGQNTVFDWLGHDEKKWEKVQQAIDHWKPQRRTRGSKKTARNSANSKLINERKWEKFFITGDQIDEIYEPERYLNEAGYIANETREYLERLYDSNEAKKRVKTTKGGVTGELRKWWDLNRILGVAPKIDEPEENTDKESQPTKKNREDLRHHIIDAVVIASTCPKLVKKVTSELQKAYPRKKRKEIYIERPWKDFEGELAAAVESVKISHRTQRKVCGELHAATHYWKETNGKYASKYITRKFLTDLSKAEVGQICDDAIKKLVEDRIKEKGDIKGAFDNPIYLPNKEGSPVPVRKVRIWTKHTDENMIPIRGKEGEPQTVWVEKPENHHIEIFQIKENGTKRYICKIWNIWEISQRIEEYKKQKIKDKDPIVLRKHPNHPDAEFVMWLSKADTVLIENNDKKEVLARITGIGEGDERDESVDLKLWELRVNCKSTDLPTKETKDGYRLRNINDFMVMKPRKVTVDFLGRIRWAERKMGWEKCFGND